MSFLTCFWLFPQNEHFSRSPPSPMRATWDVSFAYGRYAVLSSAQCVGCAPGLLSNVDRTCRHRQQPVITSGWSRCRLLRLENLVDQSVGHRLLGREDLVALDVPADLLGRLAGVVGDHL